MSDQYKPGQLVKYVGTLFVDGRQAGDMLRLDDISHSTNIDEYWQATILRTGQTTYVFDSYVQPIGDHDDGNP